MKKFSMIFLAAGGCLFAAVASSQAQLPGPSVTPPPAVPGGTVAPFTTPAAPAPYASPAVQPLHGPVGIQGNLSTPASNPPVTRAPGQPMPVAPFVTPVVRPLATPFVQPLHSPAPFAPSSVSPVLEETTPMDTPLSESRPMTIACRAAPAPATESEDYILRSYLLAGEKITDTLWHYNLHIPTGYLANPTKKWPVMFVMSPGGEAKMGPMAEHLKFKNYLVVLLVESKNGPWGPVVGDFLAAHDDVVKRLHVDETKKFATGFSGGARGASLFAQMRPGFVGLLLQGAGAAPYKNNGHYVAGLRSNDKLFIAMTMGDGDKNRKEVDEMRREVGAPSRLETFSFPGGHEWAPRQPVEDALTWLEQKNGI